MINLRLIREMKDSRMYHHDQCDSSYEHRVCDDA